MAQMAMLLRYFWQLSKLCSCISFGFIFYSPIWSRLLELKGEGLLGININKLMS